MNPQDQYNAIPRLDADPAALAQHLLMLRDIAAQESMAHWAEWMFYAGLLQLVLAIAGTAAVLMTIRQSIKANKIAHEASVRSQRAWISTDLEITGDLIWSRDGGLSLSVDVVVRNIGPTPALNVHTSVDMTFLSSHNREAVRRFGEQNRVRDEETSRVCLPGESYLRAWGPTAHVDQLSETYRAAGFYVPIIIGCVTYEVQGDNALHQTQFAYIIEPVDPHLNLLIGVSVPPTAFKVQGWSGGHAD